MAHMRRILLAATGTFLEARGCHFSDRSGSRRASMVTPPLGIPYLAAAARREGHEVKVIYLREDAGLEAHARAACRDFRPDAAGLTCLYQDEGLARRFFGAVKADHPACLALCGGMDASVRPEVYLREAGADAVVRGEGEAAFVELLRGGPEDLPRVAGLSLLRGGRVLHTAERPLAAALDALAPPALEVYDGVDLADSPFASASSGLAPLLSARGCPFHCSMCGTSALWRRLYRPHSDERVLSEIRTLRARSSVKTLIFLDETFTLDKRRTLGLCRSLEASGLGGHWICQTRADCVDAEVLGAMRRAGCAYVNFGIESASDRLLVLLEKGMTVEANLRAVALARKAGLKVSASFMVGLPTETARETALTAELAKSPVFDYVGVAAFIPFPGSPLSQAALAQGRLEPGPDGRSVWVPARRECSEFEAAQREVDAFRSRPA